MFTDLNERLIEIKDNMRKKIKYEEHLERMQKDLLEEKAKAERLESQLLKEKEDVSRLESFSLTNIIYTITGRKLEKLEQEQQEVLAAKLKYTEALETVRDMERELVEIKTNFNTYQHAEREYENILIQKERMIHDQQSVWSERLFELADQEATINASLKEYEEAIRAGDLTVSALDNALEKLDSARNWSTFDMFGGGMISTAMKHSRFDEAKEYIHVAQRRLRQFKEELLDIENHFQTSFETGGMLTFADYFFDGFIVDWIVHGKINDCFTETVRTKSDVSKMVNILKKQRTELEEKLNTIQTERIHVLESTK